MIDYLKPHTAEWFKVLETVNPPQAAHTKHILSLADCDAVCSICGDESNRDYKLVNEEAAHGPVSTMRLCKDCLDIRRTVYNENFVPVSKLMGGDCCQERGLQPRALRRQAYC